MRHSDFRRLIAMRFGHPWRIAYHLSVEADGPPRFLESPDANMPRSSTPVGPRHQTLCSVEVRPSVFRTTSAPT